jgi:hypothetical protein
MPDRGSLIELWHRRYEYPQGPPGPGEPVCRVDWQAFGVHPAGPPCHRPAAYKIIQGCIHEHIHEALVCEWHLTIMLTYLPLDEWGCGPCAFNEPRHACNAPVVATALTY